jgi:hypothetical protein
MFCTNLQEREKAIMSELASHSSSVKKFTMDDRHSCKMPERQRSLRSKKNRVTMTAKFSASEVVKMDLDFLPKHHNYPNLSPISQA